MPAASTSPIAVQPSSRVRRNTTSASAASGAGNSRRRTAVITPSVPSEPINRLFRSYPATSLPVQPPNCTSSPGASTASNPLTQSPVTPYFSACGPPALVATLPPICDCSAAPGSGANNSPFSRASRCTWRVRHARLRLHSPKRRIELAHATAGARASNDPAVHRHRTAGKARAPATGDDRHLVCIAPAHHRGHLLGASRQHHRLGAPLHPAAARAVAVVGRSRRHIQHVLGADQPAQLTRQPIAPHGPRLPLGLRSAGRGG